MDRAEALALLGLSGEVDGARIDAAFSEKKTGIEARMTSAPTAALRAKYREQLSVLEEARAALSQAPPAARPASLSATKFADLPAAGPGYTTDGSGPAGAAVGLQPGHVLAGRYEIREQIGAGGMGAVFRAFDKTRGQEIAIKVLLPSLLQSEKARERFLSEAKLSSDLSHPGIVNVYDVQQDGDFFFITMELLEGQNLRDAMEARKLAGQIYSQREVVDILRTLCDALTHAHEITVHRDIKPENIWLGVDGKIKLMDFGIARVIGTAQMTRAGAAMGTAYYMAPEQLAGRADIDGRADQYALGVMAYEMLAGEVPVGMVKPLKARRKDISKGFSAAITRALQPVPEDRFGSVDELIAALSGKGGRIKGSKTGRPAVSIDLGSRATLIGGGIAALAVVLLLIFFGGPLWDGLMEMIPDAEREAQMEADALRLDGVVKGLQRRLEASERELATTLRDAQSEIRRLEGTLRSARNDTERGTARAALDEAEKQLLLAEEHLEIIEAAVFASPEILAVDGRLSVASSRLREKRYAEAAVDLAAVETILSSKLAMIGEARAMVGERLPATKALSDWRKVMAAMREKIFPAATAEIEGLESTARRQQASWAFAEAGKAWGAITGRLGDLLPEARAWSRALNSGRPVDYKAYTTGWPTGVYAEDAKTRRQGVFAAEQEAAWAAAVRANSSASYAAYLKAWPQGAHAGDAEARRQTALAAERKAIRPTAIAASQLYSCVLRSDGGVLCWGMNFGGRTDVPPTARSGVTAIAAGWEHSCALKGGGVLCWGNNNYGQTNVPSRARSGISTIATRGYHSCALKDGGVLCWGYNGFGQNDVPAGARSGVSAIAAGGYHSCALKAGGMLCWGWNNHGQTNVPSRARSGISAIALGFYHTCALKGGGVLCWGYNEYGQSDVPPGARSGVSAVAAGRYHSCALRDGGMLCWGENGKGQSDVPPGALSGVSAISVGWSHSCALKAGGMLCWGDNEFGQSDIPPQIRAPE